jgi:hypothetical protein
VLPGRFGGAPTDFQLIEEEAEGGEPRLRLVVHPRLGPLDPDQVAAVFLDAIGAGTGVERLMGLVWRHSRFLRVERAVPLSTRSGKILHLLTHREQAPLAGSTHLAPARARYRRRDLRPGAESTPTAARRTVAGHASGRGRGAARRVSARPG